MTLRKLGTSIPAHNGYPGLLSHEISETREIVVIGSGPEAQKALEAALTKISPSLDKCELSA